MSKRPKLTCKRCRQRRVKCDKKLPCGSCVRSKRPDLCIYESESDYMDSYNKTGLYVFEVKSTQYTSFSADMESICSLNLLQIISMLVGKNSFDSPNDKINFYDQWDNGKKKTVNSPLGWECILLKDQALLFITKFMNEKLKLEDRSHIITVSEKNNLEIHEGQLSLDKAVIPLHIRIENMLPSLSSIWHLLDSFFKRLYFFLPIVDPKVLNEALRRIISCNEIGSRVKVTISKKLDYAYLGILLVILRSESIIESYDSHLNHYEIKSSMIELALECLNTFNLVGKSEIEILQCALFLRIYQRMAPESGEGIIPVESNIYTGSLIQMAFTLHLNVDNGSDNSTEAIMKKRIWHLLLIFDLLEANSRGTYLISNSAYSVIDFRENIETDRAFSVSLNPSLERSIHSVFTASSKLASVYRRVMSMILNPTSNVRISKVVEVINVYESKITKGLGFLPLYLMPITKDTADVDIQIKIHKFKVLLSSKALLLSIYIHLMLHYESKSVGQLTMFYLQRIQFLVIGEVLSAAARLSEDFQLYFGGIGKLVLTSYLSMIVHRASITCFSCLVRFKYHLYHFDSIYQDVQNSAAIRSELQASALNITKCIRTFNSALSKLSEHFSLILPGSINSHNFINILESPEFIPSINETVNFGNFKFTVSFLKACNHLYEEALETVPDLDSTEESSDTFTEFFQADIDFNFGNPNHFDDSLESFLKETGLGDTEYPIISELFSS